MKRTATRLEMEVYVTDSCILPYMVSGHWQSDCILGVRLMVGVEYKNIAHFSFFSSFSTFYELISVSLLCRFFFSYFFLTEVMRRCIETDYFNTHINIFIDISVIYIVTPLRLLFVTQQRLEPAPDI